jgi:ATP-dependent exoDNAse (exonuclease V) beta subunit
LKNSVPFLIYDAAAGSGKTFTLVKEYLIKILSNPKPDYYKHLLAITFTNKAVAEMKQRIVKNLRVFSESSTLSAPPSMLIEISRETGLDMAQLHDRSKKILKHLIHHYAGFSVETIDSFNHRLIRTFARDLKIASNFEVSLEEGQLLSEAVDRLVSKAGAEEKITRVLIDFALYKTDEDKSWDISRDIASAAQLLFSENDSTQVAKLKEKSLDDFIAFTKQLRKQQQEFASKIEGIASQTLQLIEESGLEDDDFSSKSLPSHFRKLKNGQTVEFTLKWQESLGEKPLYPLRVAKNAPHAAQTIDELTPVFAEAFQKTKALYYKESLLTAILKNLIPLSVINLVNEELEAIKTERNLFPISQFNSLINSEIRDQPAPFIYERLGEKYRHFFIDEFQDTSLLQWKNLIPLIDNALSQQIENDQPGSLLIVGDAKQSIYRWRGGLPEQFIGLYGDSNPFSIQQKKVENLPTNWRSCKNIVAFNNEFFSHIASNFGNEAHRELYFRGNRQLSNQKEGGFIKLMFNESQNKTELHEVYAQQVIETIHSLKEQQYALSEICILTRKKIDGIALGAFLMEQDIPVVSPETLLLQHSPVIEFLINSLTLSLFFDHNERKVVFLDFLKSHLELQVSSHNLYLAFLYASSEEFSEGLKKFGIEFSFSELQSTSLYESLELIILRFHLEKYSDAYLDSFMNLAFDFEQQPLSGKLLFLEHWESVKESAAVPVNESIDAVRLMTIHKAKGLEFPVVLFPYADENIYSEIDPKVWYPFPDATSPFDEVLINYKKEISHYGPEAHEIYTRHRETLELDSFNLLYVTLTRSIEQLYIFAKKTKKSTGDSLRYNDLFIDFLKYKGVWEEDKLSYEFGIAERSLDGKAADRPVPVQPEYHLTLPADHNIKIVSTEASLWQTESETAIAAGNILHDTMALIMHRDDLPLVIEDLETNILLSDMERNEISETLTQIIDHPLLAPYFSEYNSVINERDIITPKGVLQRPDRVNINTDGSVTIIDYKTGEAHEHHEIQIRGYAAALQDMGYRIKEMLIIYTSGEEILINKI